MNVLFQMGQCVATPGALQVLTYNDTDYLDLLHRHCTGDWGEIHPDDKGMNEAAIKGGNRIMSVYKVGEDKVWIITEADRSATTMLLPEEY